MKQYAVLGFIFGRLLFSYIFEIIIHWFCAMHYAGDVASLPLSSLQSIRSLIV